MPQTDCLHLVFPTSLILFSFKTTPIRLFPYSVTKTAGQDHQEPLVAKPNGQYSTPILMRHNSNIIKMENM